MRKIFFIILFLFFILSPGMVRADNSSLALTITPPIIKLNLGPGESLATAVKIVNNNSYPVTVYAKTVDFADNGLGGIKFLNNGDLAKTPENANTYLSQWITLNQDKQDLQPFQTATFPFSIDVPLNAAPGGHYAAILVGTNPPEETAHGAEIKVSSYISSLILLRVSGNIEEKGAIREFTFSPRIYQGGTGTFRMSFANTGNVDLAPVGDIKIFDMFGKEKGDVAVNQTSDYSGNVLPASVRAWNNLKWDGDEFFLVNRYRAELSLSYGVEAKQTDFSTFYFWAFNWREIIFTAGGIILLLALLILFVRFYIRQSVKSLEKQFKAEAAAKRKIEKKKAVVEKKEEKKIIDLRKR